MTSYVMRKGALFPTPLLAVLLLHELGAPRAVRELDLGRVRRLVREAVARTPRGEDFDSRLRQEVERALTAWEGERGQGDEGEEGKTTARLRVVVRALR